MVIHEEDGEEENAIETATVGEQSRIAEEVNLPDDDAQNELIPTQHQQVIEPIAVQD